MSLNVDADNSYAVSRMSDTSSASSHDSLSLYFSAMSHDLTAALSPSRVQPLKESYAAALQAFEAIFKKSYTPPYEHIHLGDHAMRFKNYEKALSYYDMAWNGIETVKEISATERRRIRAFLLARTSWCHYYQDNFHWAMENICASLKIFESNLDMLQLRGMVFLRLSQLDEALYDFETVVRGDPNNLWALAYSGEVLRQQGLLERAKRAFDSVLARDKKHTYARARRASCLKLMGCYDEALDEFRKVIKSNLFDPFAWSQRGEIHLLLGNISKAAVDFQKALTLDGRCSLALQGMSEVYGIRGNCRKAFELLMSIPKDNNSNDAYHHEVIGIDYKKHGANWSSDILVNRGCEDYELRKNGKELYLQRAIDRIDAGLWDGALLDLRKVLKYDPKNVQALWLQGDVERLLYRHSQAMCSLCLSLGYYCRQANAIARRGELFRIRGCTREALRDLNRAVRWDPSCAFALASRACVLEQLKQHEQARADLAEALKLAPNDAEILSIKALFIMRERRFDDALATLDSAYRIAPRHPQVLERRAQLYKRMGQPEKALQDVNKLLDIAPRHENGLLLRCELFINKGDLSAAYADATDAHTANPTSMTPQVRRAEIYTYMEWFDKAKSNFYDVLKLHKDNFLAHEKLGQLHLYLDERDNAIAHLDNALAINPRSAYALARRAEIRRRNGNERGANADIALALDIEPREPYALACKSLIHNDGRFARQALTFIKEEPYLQSAYAIFLIRNGYDKEGQSLLFAVAKRFPAFTLPPMPPRHAKTEPLSNVVANYIKTLFSLR